MRLLRCFLPQPELEHRNVVTSGNPVVKVTAKSRFNRATVLVFFIIVCVFWAHSNFPDTQLHQRFKVQVLGSSINISKKTWEDFEVWKNYS
jgi:hypothetical protein